MQKIKEVNMKKSIEKQQFNRETDKANTVKVIQE
jgi:hypothetical protein